MTHTSAPPRLEGCMTICCSSYHNCIKNALCRPSSADSYRQTISQHCGAILHLHPACVILDMAVRMSHAQHSPESNVIIRSKLEIHLALSQRSASLALSPPVVANDMLQVSASPRMVPTCHSGTEIEGACLPMCLLHRPVPGVRQQESRPLLVCLLALAESQPHL